LSSKTKQKSQEKEFGQLNGELVLQIKNAKIEIQLATTN